MIPRGEFCLERVALGENAAPMRHALAAFLAALNVPERVALDVVTAVGEALANSVEHAYRDCPVGEVKILARLENGGILVVEVVDRGTFAAPKRRPNRGFGLRIVRSVAQNVRLETACGTSIRMRFNLGSS